MSEVKVIKASKDGRTSRGRTVELLRVAAYCRVSTDTEDQMNSYNSQLQYYTDLISKNPKWEMVDIYADAAITGTKADKRDGFQSMIADCLHGKVDQIITKSISRFARNTVDTLKYVRLLKEHNVAVIFEDEGINTMTMDGELLLTVLSSVAQQEVENISANVKKGLKMKMQRGEMVGFNGCLGYDYDPETKTISVNENERHIVEYIFDRYVQGAGCLMIAKELRRAGEKKKDGTTDWKDSQIRGIIRNVKYMGDLVMGKTFTVDPITKRRLKNLGEEDMYYIENNHEPIISRELFDRYQYRYDYAEDLDLGIRLLEDGYRIKLLSGVRTVHGHDRPAGYYFKRGFVEARSLKKILKENGAGQGDFSDAVQYLFDGCRAMDRIADLFKAPHQEDQVLREALQLTDSCRKKNGVFFSGAFRNLVKYFLRQYVPYLLYHKQKWSREDYRRYTLACMYKQHALLAGYSFGKIADAPEDLSKIENLCKGV